MGIAVLAGVAALAHVHAVALAEDITLPNSGTTLYWSDVFGVPDDETANYDVLVPAGANYLSPMYIQLSKGHSLGTLTFSSTPSTGLTFQNASILTGTPAIGLSGGAINFNSNASVAFDVPIIFNSDATIDIGNNNFGELHFNRSVTLAGALTITGLYRGTGASVEFGDTAPLTVTALNIDSGRVALHSSLSGRPINIGDGNRSQLAELDTAGSISLAAMTIRSDGKWFMGGNANATLLSLDLQGGEIELNGHTITLLSSLVTAAPAILSDSSSKAASIGDTLFGKDATTLDLGGKQVEFRVSSNGDATDALHVVHTVITDGSLLKTGDGDMILNGAQANTFGTTTIHDGALILANSDGAIALPSDVYVGPAVNGASPSLVNRHNEQIANTAVVSVYQSGTWNLNDHTETIAGLVVAGGQVTGTTGAKLILNGDVAALGVSGLNTLISAPLDLNGGTRTFSTGPYPGGGSEPDLLISGPITNGHLIKDESGSLRLTGSSDNTITNTQVLDGTLELGKSGALALGAGLTVGTAGQTSGGPTVRWLGNSQIDSNTTINLKSGTLDLNGHAQTIRGFYATNGGTADITTGAGSFKVTSDTYVTGGTTVNYAGNLNLQDGPRQFVVSGSSLTFIGGGIYNGTFVANGSSTILFDNVIAGDAAVNVIGKVETTNAHFTGLSGAGNVTVDDGGVLTIEQNGDTTFSGVLGGEGGFTKSGAGTLTLSGNTANTLSGKTTVSGGTLKLNKVHAVAGPLVIRNGAIVDATANVAINAEDTTLTMSGGTLKLHSTVQGIGNLTMTGGAIIGGPPESPAILYVNGDISVKHATIDPVYFVTGGDLTLGDGATADIRGSIGGSAYLGDGSRLVVEDVNSSDPELTITGNLTLDEQNVTIALLLGQAEGPSLIDVQGSTQAGTTITFYTPFPYMTGVANIDLSDNASLALGTYNLINFDQAAVFGLYPGLSNFNLIGPQSGQGYLAINNHVLQYVSVPEPDARLLCGIVGLALLSLRRRRRVGCA